ARDGGAAIIDGNERVLRSRLADAKFFWDHDRKLRLEERLPALKDIVFHAKLGSQADRVMRIESLATEIAPYVPGADAGQAVLAAHLCKADLLSGMVGEFPELQGVMGRYYALEEKLPSAVADAIGDHYAPAGPNDRCPSAPLSMTLALADKIDALRSFWSIGEKPTGSRDPYALRRAALGIIRIVVENTIRLPLGKFFDAPDLMAFFARRLKVQMRGKGGRHGVIDAVFALGGGAAGARRGGAVVPRQRSGQESADCLWARRQYRSRGRAKGQDSVRQDRGPGRSAIVRASRGESLAGPARCAVVERADPARR